MRTKLSTCTCTVLIHVVWVDEEVSQTERERETCM